MSHSAVTLWNTVEFFMPEKQGDKRPMLAYCIVKFHPSDVENIGHYIVVKCPSFPHVEGINLSLGLKERIDMIQLETSIQEFPIFKVQ